MEIKLNLDQPKLLFILLIIVLVGLIVSVHYDIIKSGELETIIAIIMGPIFAVQIQAFREETQRKKREENERDIENLQRQRLAFRQMMVYRANPLDSLFVQALNVISVDFQGVEPVVTAWKRYFGQLCKSKSEDSQWDEHCNDYRAQLLGAMATHLGYSFTTQELKDDRYFAQSHLDEMVMKGEILQGAHRLFAKDYPFTVLAYVKDAPEPQEPKQI